MTLGRTFDVNWYGLFITIIVAPICAAIDILSATIL
jgi:hypothetical protein